jgi:hypothetical protein
MTNGYCIQQAKTESEKNKTADDSQKQASSQVADNNVTQSQIIVKSSEEKCQKDSKQEVKKTEEAQKQVVLDSPILIPQETTSQSQSQYQQQQQQQQQQPQQQQEQQQQQQSSNPIGQSQEQVQLTPVFQQTSYSPYIPNPSNGQAPSCSNYSAPQVTCTQLNTFLLNGQCFCKVGFSNINGYCQVQDSPIQLQPIFLDTLTPNSCQPTPQPNRCG